MESYCSDIGPTCFNTDLTPWRIYSLKNIKTITPPVQQDASHMLSWYEWDVQTCAYTLQLGPERTPVSRAVSIRTENKESRPPVTPPKRLRLQDAAKCFMILVLGYRKFLFPGLKQMFFEKSGSPRQQSIQPLQVTRAEGIHWLQSWRRAVYWFTAPG